jgi:hypothetical protein
MKVALCDFRKEVGWRVLTVSESSGVGVRLFRFGAIRLLVVPLFVKCSPGHFCNPRRLMCL